MTPQEYTDEWKYRYTERIRIMRPEGEPTREQMDIAGQEADEAVEKLKNSTGCASD